MAPQRLNAWKRHLHYMYSHTLMRPSLACYRDKNIIPTPPAVSQNPSFPTKAPHYRCAQIMAAEMCLSRQPFPEFFSCLLRSPFSSTSQPPQPVATNEDLHPAHDTKPILTTTDSHSPKEFRASKPSAPLVDEIVDYLADLLVTYEGDPAGAPAAALSNEASMQLLLQFLDDVSPPMTEFPKASVRRLEFFLRSETPRGGEDHRRVNMELKTTGGLCKKMVEKSLGSFLEECGLPGKFRWGKDCWELTEAVPIKTRPIENPDTLTPSEILAVGNDETDEGANSSPSFSRSSSLEMDSKDGLDGERGVMESEKGGQKEGVGVDSREEHSTSEGSKDSSLSIEEAVQKLDPILEALATLPWHEDEADRSRIKRELLDTLEEDGWKVGEGVLKIWGGERELVNVVLGVDAASVEALKGVLYHTKRYDAEFGKAIAPELASQQ